MLSKEAIFPDAYSFTQISGHHLKLYQFDSMNSHKVFTKHLALCQLLKMLRLITKKFPVLLALTAYQGRF